MRQINHIRGLVLLFMFFAFTASGVAQHTHFVYFQHEQSAPFYIKYQGQILRSSAQGYLILSKLSKGNHILYIGVADSGQQSVKFVLDSLQSDKGYLIKDFGASGWGLYDMQTSAVLYGKPDDIAGLASRDQNTGDAVSKDGFGDMLADVTKDSTVKYVSVIKPEKKADTVQKAKVTPKTDSLLADKSVDNKKEESLTVKPDASGVKPKISSVILLGTTEMPGVRSFMFAVETNGLKDTVQVLIDKAAVTEMPVKDTLKTETVSADTVTNMPVVDVLIPSVSDSVILIRDTVKMQTQPEAKSQCSTVADEYAFVKLRQQMAGQMNEEKMIEDALDTFKKVCFTTVQLRRLSLLLTTEEMKYRFFAAASKYVYDAQQFPSLRNELQDEVYRRQFDALIANP